MSMNIFRHEFKMHSISVLTWSAAQAVMIFVFVSMFSSISQDAALLNEMMTKFPKELLTAFGMNGLDLSTVLGFFSFIFFFVQLLLAIQAANYGFSLVSIEEREWTADFLLAKPVKRTQILTSKLLAALASLTITNVIVWISSFTFISLMKGDKTFETKTLALLLLSIVAFQLFFPGRRFGGFVAGETDQERDALCDGFRFWNVRAERFWRHAGGECIGKAHAL